MLKHILNRSESVTDARLREICTDFDAKVYAKVRVADVFELERSGIARKLYSFALRAHFDFVITESDHNPIFAVEFDGPGHGSADAKRRDRLKNKLCDYFNFPLLRVNQRYLSLKFSNWDLLGWFCTAWFVKRDWDKAVLERKIPYEDSIFDPRFVSVATKSGSRGLELAWRARSEFGRLFRAGVLPSHMAEWIVAKDKDGTLRALAWIKVSEVEGVLTETAMQQQRVGDWAHFAIQGIVLSLLAESVCSVLASQASPAPISDIHARAEKFRNDYQMLMACGNDAVGS